MTCHLITYRPHARLVEAASSAPEGKLRGPRGPQERTRQNPAGLTNRQLEVARLLDHGLSNNEIANRLVLSVRTVEHHVEAVLGKVGVHSRRELQARAGELGLSRVPDAP